jgi:hypothetical protein
LRFEGNEADTAYSGGDQSFRQLPRDDYYTFEADDTVLGQLQFRGRQFQLF